MESRSARPYPENPVLCRIHRAGCVESVHRGAWCLTDAAGAVIAGQGEFQAPFFARSSVKSLQVLPLFETGALRRFGLDDEEVALAVASHSGEPCHTRTVRRTLDRLALSVDHLQCGVHPPNDPETRRALTLEGCDPNPLHNNCSGKHAGFLALGLHLGVVAENYLDPASAGQCLVRSAIEEMCGLPGESLSPSIDGCSAPTYRLPLNALAMAFARVANPEGLAQERREALQRITRVAARHPELIGGTVKRIDTDLLRASGGRLFAKIGAEAIHAIGIVGGDRGLAVKIDDGRVRGLHAVVIGLLEGLKLATPDELKHLERWSDPTLRNHAGQEVGRVELAVEV
ncbi:MAG: asparaginase [Planctomycetes bacterium]|nr:asparaginase [Planctomycetota bacterium]